MLVRIYIERKNYLNLFGTKRICIKVESLREIFFARKNIFGRAAPIPKFPPIPLPILEYSPIPIPQIADTFADTDTFGYNFFN